MNVDRIFDTLNQFGVAYLLIGGMNFLLRHAPVTTYDVDLWIEDAPDNRDRTEKALAALDAEWGRTDADWGLVCLKPPGWSASQTVFCLNSAAGAIDIFRAVAGLPAWSICHQRAIRERTAGGIEYYGIGDVDMLQCQYALDPGLRRSDRVLALEKALKSPP